MRYILTGLLFVTGCRSVIESTQTERRDTLIVFQPSPIETVFTVGETPSGVLNPDCDTLAILERYADFGLVSETEYYSLKLKYDAKDRRVKVLENRPQEVRVIPIESIYKQTKIVKDSLFDRIKTGAVGFVVAIGLGLVVIVVLKFKGVL